VSVRFEKDCGVAWIILSRPEALNALDTQALRRSRELLSEACGDDEIVLAVFTGEGRFFSAGIDLGEVAAAQSPSEAQRPFQALRVLIGEMLDCKKPVAALLNGPAVAGGAEIALAADLTLAVEGAYLQWPELKWGLIPPVLATVARRGAPQALSSAIFLMDRVDARTAYSLGLVSHVYSTLEEAHAAIRGLAGTLRGAGRTAVALVLEQVRSGKRGAVELGRELERLAASEELIRRAREFVESRRRG